MVTTALNYNPNATYEVRWRDVEYRKDASGSWLARVYQPQGAGPFPALLEVHGGAWNNNDRTQNEPLNQAVAASGIVVTAIDFHNAPQAPYPASIQDVHFATRWLKLHARDFNASPEMLGGSGFSSGGHIVMLSAMRPRDHMYSAHDGELPGDADASFAYVIVGWPVIDPTARYRLAQSQGREPLMANHLRYFGDEATQDAANTQLILERGEAVETPPLLFLQGAADEALTPDMGERFALAYSRAGGVVELAKYPGAPHGFLREPGPNADRAMALVKSFIARQLQAATSG